MPIYVYLLFSTTLLQKQFATQKLHLPSNVTRINLCGLVPQSKTILILTAAVIPVPEVAVFCFLTWQLFLLAVWYKFVWIVRVAPISELRLYIEASSRSIDSRNYTLIFVKFYFILFTYVCCGSWCFLRAN